MRVLHGLTGAAGQPAAISQAQRALGIDSSCVLQGLSKYGYKSDISLEVGLDEQKDLSDFLCARFNDYDVFHMYYRPYFYFKSSSLVFPTGLDLMALRSAGKTVIFNNRGSEVRTAEKFKKFSPYNYVRENPNRLFTKFPARVVDLTMKYVKGVANRVLVPDPELQSYVPGSEVVPRAIDLKKWECVGVTKRKKPLVVHAPTRRVVKGSDWVLKAVSSLRSQGCEFDFQIIQGMSNDEARAVYQNADIVVDQLRIGWYGVLAAECMALGKPVVAYIRDDLRHHLAKDEPLVNANPDNITHVLKGLIDSYDRRRDQSVRARAYSENVHDANKVAKQLIDIYREEMDDPKPVDFNAVMHYLLNQRNFTRNRNPLLSVKDYVLSTAAEYKRYIGRKYMKHMYAKQA